MNPSMNLGSRLSMYHRFFAVIILGFASGLPLALTGQSMQAWLTTDGVDIATIGLFTVVGLPYTFKFLWAPLMDRFEFPLLGRRRGWLVITQFALAGVLALMALTTPAHGAIPFALLAVSVAFLSASQDVVSDAYRTDILLPSERGLGSSFFVFGYRIAMILSGGIAFIWADAQQGFGWSWPKIYTVMAFFMVGSGFFSLLFIPKVPKEAIPPRTVAKNDVIGFLSVAAAVLAGYLISQKVGQPLFTLLVSSDSPDGKKWIDLATLLFGVGITIPTALYLAKKTKFETLNASLGSFFSQPGATAFLLFIILYKLGDAFAGSLMTPFLLKSMEFSQAEVGVVNKVIGIWLTIGGALVGGALMAFLGLYRSLFAFGILQMLSNFGFYFLSVMGKGAWGGFELGAFDIFFVSLKQATHVDYLLLIAIAGENISGGMGTAAFVAFLTSLCHRKFTATQYALLSAFAAVGRVWVGPLSGVLTQSIGWPKFFLFSIFTALPGLWILYRLKLPIQTLDAPLKD